MPDEFITLKLNSKQFPEFTNDIVLRIRSKRQNIEQKAGTAFIFKIRLDIPLLTSRLRTSGYVVSKRTELGSKILFDPENPYNKEHYAEIQETNLAFEHRHGKALFLSEGLMEQSDYTVGLMRKMVYEELNKV
jgi:hypothetical protein